MHVGGDRAGGAGARHLGGIEALALYGHHVLHHRHLPLHALRRAHHLPRPHPAGGARHGVQRRQQLGEHEGRLPPHHLLAEVEQVRGVGLELLAEPRRLGLQLVVHRVHVRLQRQRRPLQRRLEQPRPRRPVGGPLVAAGLDAVDELEAAPVLPAVGQRHVLERQRRHLEQVVARQLAEVRLLHRELEPRVQRHVEHQRVAVPVRVLQVPRQLPPRLRHLPAHRHRHERPPRCGAGRATRAKGARAQRHKPRWSYKGERASGRQTMGGGGGFFWRQRAASTLSGISGGGGGVWQGGAIRGQGTGGCGGGAGHGGPCPVSTTRGGCAVSRAGCP